MGTNGIRCLLTAALLLTLCNAQLRCQEEEELVGTWVNRAYNYWDQKAAKMVIDQDMTGRFYSNTFDPVSGQSLAFTLTVDEKGSDGEGNLYCNVTFVFGPTAFMKFLVRVTAKEDLLDMDSGGWNVDVYASTINPDSEHNSFYYRESCSTPMSDRRRYR